MKNPDEVMIVRRSASLQSMFALARAERWTQVRDFPRAHTAVAAREWAGDECKIGWYEEHEFGVRRVEVCGSAEVRSRVRSRIDCYGREELLAHASPETPSYHLDALRALAILEARHPSAELIELLREWLRNPDAGVRRALLHVLRIGFYELIDDVERLAGEDAPLSVRWSRLRDAMRRRMVHTQAR